MFKRVSDVENKSGLKFSMDYPDITGFDVFDRNGNDIGEIQDLIMDTDTSMVDHAIVGRGWLATLTGEKQVIVPFDRMTVNPTDKNVRLDISRDELANFPEWKDVGQEGFVDNVRNWWSGRRAA